MVTFRFMIVMGAVLFFLGTGLQSFAQSTLKVDEKREKDLKELGTIIPNPEKLRTLAETIFSKTLAAQKIKNLQMLAKQTNRYVNMVGYIKGEYDSYNRENYQYKFVKTALAPARNAYIEISNEFKTFRNKAYFNLGLKLKSKGNKIRALLYFRDAFRLSTFSCEKGLPPQNCMRWRAEEEMQKLLGLEKVRSYVTWQK